MDYCLICGRAKHGWFATDIYHLLLVIPSPNPKIPRLYSTLSATQSNHSWTIPEIHCFPPSSLPLKTRFPTAAPLFGHQNPTCRKYIYIYMYMYSGSRRSILWMAHGGHLMCGLHASTLGGCKAFSGRAFKLTI